MSSKIPNLAIGGYRSFGTVQRFENFSKINLFIGRNNSGKSNVLRFLAEIYSANWEKSPQIDQLSRHLPDMPPLIVGVGEKIPEIKAGRIEKDPNFRFFRSDPDPNSKIGQIRTIIKIFTEKAKIDGTRLCWTLKTLPESSDKNPSWAAAVKTIENQELAVLWGTLTNTHGGDRMHSWEPEVIKRLPARIEPIPIHFIPAIRQVGGKGSVSESGYDGEGIIERLAKIQNPDAHNQRLRIKFDEITSFVQSVLDRPDARIEIPYERDTILLHMDNKVLPLDSLGTGVHEVIILAAAATTLSEEVLCIEEPELHLNPVLQRKLMRYLSDQTTNQYFITTHSPAIMDTPGAEVYHITQNNGESRVNRVTSDHQRSEACEDLGYHPSDLLQANCIIWVEGPSDRVYINYWLSNLAPQFTEGIHYSIMFYGGRLLSHLSYSEEEISVGEFIALRRLNRRGVILIDSDKSTPQTKLNATKKRLIEEFNQGPGHAWVTAGREIENYIPPSQLSSAIKNVAPKATPLSAFGRYDNSLKIKGLRGSETQASKMEIAHHISKEFKPDFENLDLKSQILKLSEFIRSSNPKAVIS